jgi:hypothetical protein
LESTDDPKKYALVNESESRIQERFPDAIYSEENQTYTVAEGLLIMHINNTFADYISTMGPGYMTIGGIQVGDSKSDVEAVFPDCEWLSLGDAGLATESCTLYFGSDSLLCDKANATYVTRFYVDGTRVRLITVSKPGADEALVSSDSTTSNSGTSAAGACTYDMYMAIEEGMSYSQVVEIIGVDGTEMSSSSVGGNTAKVYQWDGDKLYSNVIVEFLNDEVVSKAQAGLD